MVDTLRLAGIWQDGYPKCPTCKKDLIPSFWGHIWICWEDRIVVASDKLAQIMNYPIDQVAAV